MRFFILLYFFIHYTFNCIMTITPAKISMDIQAPNRDVIPSILFSPQIPQNSQSKTQRKLRLIKSQKYLLPNLQQRIQQFPQRNINSKKNKQINNRFAQLRILTKQKDELITQLNYLKEGAVSALRQKQEIIDRLKYESMRHSYFEDQKEQMQKQLNKYFRKMKQLIQEKNQISEKYQKQRTFFFEELYNKENMIDQLTSKITKLYSELDKNAEENKSLSLQILKYEQQHKNLNKKITQLTEQIQKYENDIQKINQNTQTKEQSKIKQSYNMKEMYKIQIQKINQRHQQEIEKIINYYQNQINQIKTIYERQFGNMALKKTLETQIFSDLQFQHQRQQCLSMNDLMSFKSGFQNKPTNNLRTQLKFAVKYQQNKNSNEESKSQFTNNYFSYNYKVNPLNQNIVTPNSAQYKSNQNIQQNIITSPYKSPMDCQYSSQLVIPQIPPNVSKSKQKRFLQFRKQQLYCFVGGTILGSVGFYTLMKVLHQPLN